jgi:hypothetical protein
MLVAESEKRARLNEIGKEIAQMFPSSNGSITFDCGNGQLKGIRTDAKWRPKK